MERRERTVVRSMTMGGGGGVEATSMMDELLGLSLAWPMVFVCSKTTVVLDATSELHRRRRGYQICLHESWRRPKGISNSQGKFIRTEGTLYCENFHDYIMSLTMLERRKTSRIANYAWNFNLVVS